MTTSCLGERTSALIFRISIRVTCVILLFVCAGLFVRAVLLSLRLGSLGGRLPLESLHLSSNRVCINHMLAEIF